MWTFGRAPNNANKWQMGFKGHPETGRGGPRDSG